MGSLILVRHSTTDASASGRNLGGRSDAPLSAAGISLAARLGQTLAAELAELPHDELRLVSSPARRSRQTLAAVADAIAVPQTEIETAEGLREIDYGAWDGLTADECRARDPEVRAAWEHDPYTTRCPGGESGADVALRSRAVLDPLDSWLEEDRARCAIVVAHNHVNRVRLCAIFGWPMREYRNRIVTDPGAYSVIGLGTGGPVIRRVNAAPA